MKLVIVESPSKAKTISKYLGSGFVVRASVGHVRDLPKSSKKAVDIEGGFIPHYEIVAKKQAVIDEIRKEADKADEILLATDPDREGEAIAWHIKELLTRKSLGGDISPKKIKRITYHEVTKEAVEEALEHPRPIDEHLREAQEARRVLDRLVGYDLSGLIWKKVRYGLSAGRVQSPALRIIMEREREIRAFKPEDYWTIAGLFKTAKNEDLKLTCSKEPRDKKEVDSIIEIAKKEKWQVIAVEESEVKRSPRAPFITSTLQQTASTRLGFSPSRTMGIAQKLYEAGHITYMRTDSTNLSQQALGMIAGIVEKDYGKKYHQFRTYAAKSKNAQEAHEAIRPSHFDKANAGSTDEAKRLYRLIWQRAVASQMADAVMARTKIAANVAAGIATSSGPAELAFVTPAKAVVQGQATQSSTGSKTLDSRLRGNDKEANGSPDSKLQAPSSQLPDFEATGSRVLFDGWLKADPESVGEEVNLPKCAADEKLDLQSIDAEGKQTQPPPRYTEAGLIKELEKRGIGRPSTYASITKTIEDRGYVEKENRALKPTDTGDVVSSFLEEYFPTYISDDFTAEMENELDEIANGERTYEKTLSDFYKPFHKDVKSKETLAKATNLGKADDKFKCPKCGGGMEIKLGRNGKFLSCARYPDCEGALTMDGTEFKKDEPIGNDPATGLPIFVLNGRFGPYVQLGVKMPKTKKPRVKKAKVAELSKGQNVNIGLTVIPAEAGIQGITNNHVSSNTLDPRWSLPSAKAGGGGDKAINPSIVKPRMASIPKTMDPSKVTVADAMKYLSLPKILGNDPKTNVPITASIGRFGPYVVRDKDFRSVKPPLDIYAITLEQALELLAQEKKPRGFARKKKA